MYYSLNNVWVGTNLGMWLWFITIGNVTDHMIGVISSDLPVSMWFLHTRIRLSVIEHKENGKKLKTEIKIEFSTFLLSKMKWIYGKVVW